MNARRILCPHCRTLNRVPAERAAEKGKCGACHEALFDGKPSTVDEAGFERHLRQDGIPLLVDMWAAWCGPCRTMAPMFERAAAALEPEMRLLKLDIDAAPGVASRYGIRSIPALYLFRNGEVIGQTVGAMSAEAIIGWARSQRV